MTRAFRKYKPACKAFNWILLAMVLIGCNNVSRGMEGVVDKRINKSFAYIASEIEKSKTQFIERCTKAISNAEDPRIKGTLQSLRFSVLQTGQYLDSVDRKMDSLNKDDPDDMDRVRIIFIGKNIGDSIFVKLESSIAKAKEVAVSKESKISIGRMRDSILSEPDMKKWREQFFGFAPPLGASIILYGFKSQLYDIALEALKDY